MKADVPGQGLMRPPAAFGQVGEWLVWTQMVLSSRGRLHVYLPMRDMGVDGMVRDVAANVQVPVQVKAHQPPTHGTVINSHVYDHEVADDAIRVVICVVDPATASILEPMYVIPAAEVRRGGSRFQLATAAGYAVEMGFGSRRSKWAEFACSREELAAVVCPETAELVPVEPAVPSDMRGPRGFHAEMRLVTAVSTSAVLNVFHATPDIEFVEYLVRHVGTGRVGGVQVKLAQELQARRRWQVIIGDHAHALPSRSWVVVLPPASWADEPRVLLIPSEVIRGQVRAGLTGFEFNCDPSRGLPRWVAPYVLADAGELAGAFERFLGDPPPAQLVGR